MKLISREHIDTERWNNRIQQSTTENIFCYSWYLDACAKNWSAIITDDYKTIVPIPFSKKLGVQQVYQAQFTRELDIFGNEFNWEEVLSFLAKDFKAIQFRNGTQNLLDQFETRNHQWLDLKGELNFKNNAKRLIKKADKIYSYKNSEDPTRLIELFKKTAFQKIETLNNEDLLRLEKLMKSSFENGHGELIEVFKNDEFVGAGYFLKDKKRITYLKSAAIEEDKKAGAMYGLINFAINRFKKDYLIFDFGGSDVENVATFYRKFGAEDRSYYNYELNNLPAWFKALKRIKG
ncbi:MAG: GNAT family N-acetyltransferase [Crocinitomicaceae bacterium]